MKSLKESINEALQGITLTQYKNIWKGNFNVDIDQDHIDNPIYFFTELLMAHKNELPTENEFANVCKFIVTKLGNIDKKYIDIFGTRFVEIFCNEAFNNSVSKLKNMVLPEIKKRIFSDDCDLDDIEDYKKIQLLILNKNSYVDDDEELFANKLIDDNEFTSVVGALRRAVMFGPYVFKSNIYTKALHQLLMEVLLDIFGKKWGKDHKTWPDYYTNGFSVLIKHFAK